METHRSSRMPIVTTGYSANIAELLKITLVNVPDPITKLEDIPDNYLSCVDRTTAARFRIGVRTEVLNIGIINRDARTIALAIQTAIQQIVHASGLSEIYDVLGAIAYGNSGPLYTSGIERFDQPSLIIGKIDDSEARFSINLGRNLLVESEILRSESYAGDSMLRNEPRRMAEDFHGTVKVLGVKTRFKMSTPAGLNPKHFSTDMLSHELKKIAAVKLGRHIDESPLSDFDWYVPSVAEVIHHAPFITLPELTGNQDGEMVE